MILRRIKITLAVIAFALPAALWYKTDREFRQYRHGVAYVDAMREADLSLKQMQVMDKTIWEIIDHER